MSKPKFKVGDKVNVLDGSKIKNYYANWANQYMSKFVNKTFEIKKIEQSGFYPYPGYILSIPEHSWLRFDERGLELVKPEKIIIYRNGSEVVAKNTATGKTGVARCNPADEFDFNTGAKLAFERLTNPEPEKPEYYTGKVVCIDDSGLSNTKGKVYKVLDGRLEFDGGHSSVDRFESVDQINDMLISKFIKLVE